MKRIICVFVLIVMLFQSMPSYAESSAYSIRANGNVITVSGKFDGVSVRSDVTYYAFRGDKAYGESEVNSNRENLSALGQTTTDENGNFNIEYTYNTKDSRKVETLIVTCGTQRKMFAFTLDDLPIIIGKNVDVIIDNADNSGKSDAVKKRFLEKKSQLPAEMTVQQLRSTEAQNTYYVSNSGSDTQGNGTINNPFLTIQKAVDTASAASGSSTVFLRGGDYDVNNTVCIDGVSNLTIAAYENEDVRFMEAGCVLKADEFVLANSDDDINPSSFGNIYKFDLSKVKTSLDAYTGLDNIYVTDANNQAYDYARWPNVGTIGMAKVDNELSDKYDNGTYTGVYDSGPIKAQYVFEMNADRDKGRYGGSGFEFKLNNLHPFTWNNWTDAHMCGSFYDEWDDNKVVAVNKLNPDLQSVSAKWSVYNVPRGAKYSKNNSFYFFNVLEELDMPGEWYIDRAAKMLYVYPKGELSDLTFAITDETVNAVFDVKKSSNVVLSGFDVKNIRKRFAAFSECNSCVVQNCIFDNVGANVIRMESTINSGVIFCEFSNCGGSSLANSITLECANSIFELEPDNDFIQNNMFINCGPVNVKGVGQVVSHNYFTNNKSNSVYVWNARDCVIEYNEFCQSPSAAKDCGVIYMGGINTAIGNHVRYNFVNNCKTGRSAPYCLYIDEFASDQYVYGNVISGGGEIHNHAGSEVATYNNVIVNNGSTVSINDATDYYESGKDVLWQSYLANKSGHVAYLYNGEYEKYNMDKYREKYPGFVSYSELLKKRVDEYQENKNAKSGYTQKYSNGVEDNLDGYLRYPRDNYFGNNVLINSEGTMQINDASYNKVDIVENTVTVNNSGVDNSLDCVAEFYEEILKDCNFLEKIPFENIGVGNNYISRDIEIIYPVSGMSLKSDSLCAKWNNDLAVSKYLVELYNDGNLTFSDEVIDNKIELSNLNLPEGLYSLKITAISEGSNMSVGNAEASVNFNIDGAQSNFAGYISDLKLDSDTISFCFYNVDLQKSGNIVISYYNGMTLSDVNVFDSKNYQQLGSISVPVSKNTFNSVKVFYVDLFSDVKPLAKCRAILK